MMKTINVKKTHVQAQLPAKMNSSDAGFDCYAVEINETEDFLEYNLGFQVEIPQGFFGLLVARSSITKYDLMVKNSVGIIDAGYRGDVKLRTKKFGEKIYNVGERVCQLLILPVPEFSFVEVDQLDTENDRLGGFGSTGK
jgi:dUTP pyrophosphatase